jgi:hypothetical protein
VKLVVVRLLVKFVGVIGFVDVVVTLAGGVELPGPVVELLAEL